MASIEHVDKRDRTYLERRILDISRFVETEIEAFSFIGYEASYKLLELFPELIKINVREFFPNPSEIQGLESEYMQRLEVQRNAYLTEVSRVLEEKGKKHSCSAEDFDKDLGKILRELSKEVKTL